MRFATAGIVMAMVTFAGCEKNDSSTATGKPGEVSQNTSSAGSGESARAASHEAMVSEWRRQLDGVKTKVGDMKGRAATASADVRADFEDAIKSMDQQASEVQSRLDGFKESAGASWETFTSDIKARLARLETDARDATDKYMRGPTNPPPANPQTPPAIPPAPSPNPDRPPMPDSPPSPDAPPTDPSSPK